MEEILHDLRLGPPLYCSCLDFDALCVGQDACHEPYGHRTEQGFWVVAWPRRRGGGGEVLFSKAR